MLLQHRNNGSISYSSTTLPNSQFWEEYDQSWATEAMKQ
jgi:hypothetical protein